MTTERLIVRIRPDGTVDARTEGITGPRCLEWIDALQELAEATAVDSFFTAEYYEQSGQGETERSHQSLNIGEPPT